MDADASPEDIEAVVAQSQKRSAVFDILTNPTAVRVDVTDGLMSVDHRRGGRRRAQRPGCEPPPAPTARSTTWSSSAAQVAHSWRTQRWDSLRLLTPELDDPAAGARGTPGDDPDGYLTAARGRRPGHRLRVAIARRCTPSTTVTARARRPVSGFVVETDRRRRGSARGRGAGRRAAPRRGARPSPPPCRRGPLGARASTTGTRSSCPRAACWWSGPSSSGVQIAEEVHLSGRPVTLAAGEHVRLPRRYRDRDILWWMDAVGILDERWDEVDDIAPRPATCRRCSWSAATAHARPQRAAGRWASRLVGRLAGDARRAGPALRVAAQRVRAGRPQAQPAARTHRRARRRRRASGSSRRRCRTPPLRSRPALRRDPARSSGRPASSRTTPGSTYRSSTARGRLRHDGGVTDWPGLYVTGLPGAASPPLDVHRRRRRGRRRPDRASG